MPFIEACVLEAWYADADPNTINYVVTTSTNDEETLSARKGEALYETLSGWLRLKGVRP